MRDIEYYKKEKKEWLDFLRMFREELTYQDMKWIWLYVDRFDKSIEKLQNPNWLQEKQKQEQLDRAFAREVIKYGR
jgi:hypothetical protein